MGGRGSGRQVGLGSATCEDFHAIDLASIQREGFLAPGYVGRITWLRGDRQTGWIQYRVERQGLRLEFRTRSYGQPWEDVSEFVPLVETATNFSGRRVWFQCLGCQGKCRILYGGDRFRCRRCWRLKYRSQYETTGHRAADRAHKRRARLGYWGRLTDPFPPKPNGMHWTTYFRLEDQDASFRTVFWHGVTDYLEKTHHNCKVDTSTPNRKIV